MTNETNLIFDLQLFDDETPEPEIYKAGSKAEIIVVNNNDATADGTPLTPKKNGAAFAGVNAGGGNDSITVNSSEKTIIGAGGNDYIDIKTNGNTYVYNSSDGSDTIEGWGNKDILQLTFNANANKITTAMSTDGNDFIVNFGGKSITFKGATAGSTSVTYQNKNGSGETLVAPKKIEGTSKGESITNPIKESVSASEAWTIDGAAGNDSISNNKPYVSIVGGAGNDIISVSANNNTINGGKGNDSINFTADTQYHVFEYKKGDGKDTIVGYSDNDTIVLSGFTTNDITKTIIPKSDVDTAGNYVLNLGSGSITIKKPDIGNLGEKKLNVKTDGGEIITVGVDDNGSRIIPKKILGKTSADSITVAESLAGYTVDAQAGNDKITVEAGASNTSIVAGAGNDTISLGSATDGVTINGGAGNDSINASGTTKGHVYQFGKSDGKDTIVGFNSSDSIQITTTNTKVSGDFDSTGKDFVLKVGSATLTLKEYKGGNTFHLIDADGNPFDNINEKNNIITNTSGNIFKIDSELRGTTGKDSLDNSDTSFFVNALAGNDSIYNNSAGNNVSIDAGAGNDTITNLGATVLINAGAGNDKITNSGADVSIDAGAGNDTISLGSAALRNFIDAGAGNDVISLSSASSTFIFGASDGKDTVYSFGANDSIKTAENTYFIGSEVDQKNQTDLILNFAKTASAKKASSTITLKNYLSDTAATHTINIVGSEGTASLYTVPKEKWGTTGNDKDASSGKKPALNNSVSGYTIYALAGNDSIYNTGASVTVDAGVGNDTITNSGSEVSIFGGAGNDKISILGSAASDTIVVGAGNDSVYSNDIGKHIYQFGSNDGTNYIYNFHESDTLVFSDSKSSFEKLKFGSDVTELGVTFNFGKTVVILKGASETATTYAEFAGGNHVSVKADGTDTGINTIWTVPKKIVGTTGNDIGAHSLVSNLDGYTIDAKAGNDSIFSSGNSNSINAGAGNDTISIGASVSSDTIYAGAGNDLIYGASNTTSGNTYYYKKGDGNDTILGWHASDTLLIDGVGSYTPTITTDGFQIKVGSNTILLKGGRKSNTTTYKVTDYDTLAGDTHINISVRASGDTYTDSSTNVPKILLGTASGESIQVTGAYHDHSVLAFDGKDTIDIQSAASDVHIYAGAGNDSIYVASDTTGVSINVGEGTDTIAIGHGSNVGHVFEFGKNDGTNYIYGLNSNDSIKLDGVSLKSAEFVTEGTNEYYALYGTTGNLVIKIQESNGTNAYQKPGKSLFNFNLTQGEAGSETRTIPNIINVIGNTAKTISNEDVARADSETAIIIGDKATNNIIYSSTTLASISTGAGNDTIYIQGGASDTILAGAGNDSIKLDGDHNYIIQYGKDDGNDVILGLNSSDTLVFASGTKVDSIMSGYDFAIKYGSNTISLKAADGNAIASGTTINYSVIGSDALSSITVPKEWHGTAKNDTFSDTNKAGYTIDTFDGKDTINNTSDNVSIFAGAGNDSIVASGTSLVIDGGADNDFIYLYGSNGSSINAGAGTDVISLGSGASNTTVFSGKGVDTIYSNGHSNTFVHESGDGNDIILGFTGNDSIRLGAGVSLKADPVKVTAEGLFLSLTDGNVIQIKGDKSDGAEGNTPNDFDYLLKDASINVVNSDASVSVLPVPAVKYVLQGSSLNNANEGYSILGTAAIDTIFNSGSEVTISSFPGNDIIYNTSAASNTSIFAGAGNDVISIQSGASGVSVRGGAGNDSIAVSSSIHSGITYIFDNGDGADTIVNFNASDTILLTGNFSDSTKFSLSSYSTVLSAENKDHKRDITFSIGKTSVVLKDYGDGDNTIKVSIAGGASETILIPYLFENNTVTGDFGDNNTFTNEHDHASIIGASSKVNETVSNSNTNVTISTGRGNDSIYNSGTTVYIYGGDDKDTIVNISSNTSIFGEADNDSIVSTGKFVYIDGGANDDYIQINEGSSGTSIFGGAGTDIIINDDINNPHVFLVSNSGGDIIRGFNIASDSIRVTDSSSVVAFNGTSSFSGKYLILQVGGAKYSIAANAEGTEALLGGQNLIIHGSDGAVVSTTYTVPKVWNGSASSDTYNVSVAGYFVNALAGNDSISNGYASVTIDAGEGNDFVSIGAGASNTSIFGGVGTDSIYNGAEGVTIFGGADNDYISNTNTTGVTYQFNKGDGTDTIYGFTTSDSIYFNFTKPNILPTITLNGAGTQASLTVAENTTLILESDTTNIDFINFKNHVYFKNGNTYTALTQNWQPTYRILTEAEGASYEVHAADSATGKMSIIGSSGNDSIVNSSASGVFIKDTLGSNTITITTVSDSLHAVTLVTGSNADSIYNSSNYSSINAGAGDNEVSIGGDYVSLFASGDADSVTISGASVLADVGAGANVVSIGSGANVSLFATSGADSVTVGGNYGYISVGAGANEVSIGGDYVSLFASGGADSVSISGESVLANVGAGKNIVSIGAASVSVVGGENEDKVIALGEYGWISLGAGADSVTVGGANSSVNVGDGLNIVSIGAASVSLVGGGDIDKVTLSGASGWISLGGGNDSITLSGGNNSIFADLGTNAISIDSSATGNSIFGGAKADSITVLGGSGFVSVGAGKNIVSIASGAASVSVVGGENEDKVIALGEYGWISLGAGADSVTVGGANSSVNVGDGLNIVSIGAASVSLFGGASIDNVTVSGNEGWIDVGAGNNIINIANGAASVTVVGGENNDSVKVAGSSASINVGNGLNIVSIGSDATSVSLFGGASIDNVTVSGDEGWIEVGAGKNIVSIASGAASVSVVGGENEDKVIALGEYGWISLGAGADSVTVGVGGTNSSVNVGDGLNIVSIGAASVSLFGGASIDNVTVSGNAGWIEVGNGNNIINIANGANSVSVLAGTGDDSITIYGDYASINAGSGTNVINIANGADSVSLVGGGGIDKVTLSGASGWISLGEGADLITVAGAKATINVGAGANEVSIGSAATSVSLLGGENNDKVTVGGANATIDVGAGENEVNITAAGVSLLGGTGADSVTISGSSGWISLGSSGDITNIINITSTADKVSLFGGSTGDKLTINGTNGRISLGAGADSVTVGGTNGWISLGAGADLITVSGSSNTIDAGDDKDTIFINSGSKNSIYGGADNDTISIATGVSGNTIYGGAGDDSIKNDSSTGNIFWYDGTDGADTIVGGLKSNDILYINNASIEDPTYTADATGGTLTFSTGNTIRLEGISTETDSTIKIKKGSNAAATEFTLTKYTAVPAGAGEGGERIAEEPIAVLDDLFEDNNFISTNTQILDISNIGADNYSAGKLETLDFTKLAENNYILATDFVSKTKK